MNLPNKITLIRIFLLPLIVVFLITPSWLSSFLAVLIFAVAIFTDWLDGHLARRTDQVTTLGKLLDPIADKLLVISALIPLVALGRVPAWMAVILVGREIAITGLRSIKASKGIIIPASQLGKSKMTLQVTAIILLILNYKILFINFHFVGMLVLWIAMIVSIISGADYFVKFITSEDLN
jgi:CDP-diacylglycerol---glycerol-3-phosphate 3-phosphatidyltransferase